MKHLLNFLLICLFLTALSCEKSIDEVNDDLNVVSTPKYENVLTAAQGYLAYNVDYELNGRVSHIWAQYYTWGIGVSIGNQERFVAQPADFNDYWSRTYSNALTDMKYISTSKEFDFSGIGKLLQAYTYQGLVDHFGDVPFSKAVSGSFDDGSIFTPTFDDAATVYGNLITLVDDGLSDLSKVTSSSIGSADLMYGGDIGKWIKFGNSLKLRLLMRISEIGDQGDAVRALINSDNFISSPSDIASIAFEGISGNENPMYARYTFGVGNFYIASNATLNVLANLEDPRDTLFYSVASTGPFKGELRGSYQGYIDNVISWGGLSNTDYSVSSPLVYGADQPVYLMTNWEVDFLRAEAAIRYATADDATVMFERAVQANFDFFGAGGISNYLANMNFAGTGSIDAKLDLIGVQKWISMNGTQEDEGWIEARRFDRPASRLFTGEGGIWQDPPLSILPDRTFPSAWLYSADERSLNPNAPPQRELTDKIFWDN